MQLFVSKSSLSLFYGENTYNLISFSKSSLTKGKKCSAEE